MGGSHRILIELSNLGFFSSAVQLLSTRLPSLFLLIDLIAASRSHEARISQGCSLAVNIIIGIAFQIKIGKKK